MEGKANSGTICMNGAAARWAEVGDKVIIIAYSLFDSREVRTLKPKILFVNEKNKVRSNKS